MEGHLSADSIVDVESAQMIDSRLAKGLMKPAFMVGIESVNTLEYNPMKPLSTLDEEITIEVQNNSSAFLDLHNSYMYVRGYMRRVVGSNLEVPTIDFKYTVANNFLHSLFSSCTLLIGTNQLELYQSNFAYSNYVKQLLRFDVQCPEMELQVLDFAPHSRKDFEGAPQSEYKASLVRAGYVSGGKKVEMAGPCGLDLFSCTSYLIPGVPLKLKYRRNNERFYMVQPPDEVKEEYHFVIESMKIFIPNITVAPTLVPLLESGLDEAPAKYVFTNMNIKQYHLPVNMSEKMFYGIFSNRLPNRFLLAFFDADSFAGNRTLDPLMSSDLDLRNVKVYVNGVCIRNTSMNYDENLYMEVYLNMLKFLNVQKKGFYLSYSDFKQGYRYYTTDLRHDNNCSAELQCIGATMTRGRLDVGISLGAALTKDVVMLVFGFNSETLHVDKHRVCKYIPTIA